jgi:hypothetical protein
VLTAETLRGMLIEIGATVTPSSIALAEALAKLGVPITEGNMAEGQSLLARLPGVSPAVFALAKALDLPPTISIMKALSAVVDRATVSNRLDLGTLDKLSLLPQPGENAEELKTYVSNLIGKLAQSTENKLLTDPDSANTLPVYDTRSALLGLSQTPSGGLTAAAANQHAAYIEGQQLLNQVSITKSETTAPLYFAFPISLTKREAECEIQIWSSREQQSTDPLAADKEEYLRATIRLDCERLGIIETCLIGMWSGRLLCSIGVSKPLSSRLIKRELPALARALGSHGWNVAPIEVAVHNHFTPLWLGGDILDNPRSRVDRRI